MPGFFIMKKIHYDNIRLGGEYTVVRTNKPGYDKVYNVDRENVVHFKVLVLTHPSRAGYRVRILSSDCDTISGRRFTDPMLTGESVSIDLALPIYQIYQKEKIVRLGKISITNRLKTWKCTR